MRAVGCDLEIVWAQRNGFLHGEAYNVYNATGLACDSKRINSWIYVYA